MNIVLVSKTGDHFFIATVKRENDAYYVMGRKVGRKGNLLSCSLFPFENKHLAISRCREMARQKEVKRGMKPVSGEEVPEFLLRFIPPPLHMQMTAEELASMIRQASSERYVTFKDVTGIEEWFDTGVQYIGQETDDQEIIDVYDRYGTLRGCALWRISECIPTEMALGLKEATA